MSRDTLSNLLRAIRLRGAIFYRVEGVTPWVAEAPPGTEIIPAILPEVDHLMEFHVVARGACWAGIVGEDPIRLGAGDFVIFPQGDAHVISSSPGLRAGRPDLGLYYGPRPPQLPYVLRVSARGTAEADPERDEPPTTIFVRFLGQPPMKYLAQWRMQLAARLLRDTDAKVLEVALEVGYENETAFARAFRHATGQSPGARRRARRARPGRRGGGKPLTPPARPPRATA